MEESAPEAVSFLKSEPGGLQWRSRNPAAEPLGHGSRQHAGSVSRALALPAAAVPLAAVTRKDQNPFVVTSILSKDSTA